ncbi:MAG: DUF4276 family protein [Planctomycetota bacterium]
MRLDLFCVVEGQGDQRAVPVLLRRIGSALVPALELAIPTPFRVPRHKLVKPGEVERVVDFAARKIRRPGAALILIDADDDCPAKLGPTILARARQARPDLPVSVVLANREFEAWFLAAFTSLSGRHGLEKVLPSFATPETIKNAKRPIEEHMLRRVYSETIDQPALTAQFDMDLARRVSPSFDKC